MYNDRRKESPPDRSTYSVTERRKDGQKTNRQMGRQMKGQKIVKGRQRKGQKDKKADILEGLTGGRQTDKQTNQRTDRKQTYRQTEKRSYLVKGDKQTDMSPNRQIDIQINRNTVGQTD